MSAEGNHLPRRKANRLEQYDYSQAGCYFVTLCTRDRQRILSHIVGDDAHIVPTPIGQVLESYIRSAPEVETYVIMPDHVHMIIRLDDGRMTDRPTDSDRGTGARSGNKVAQIVRAIKGLSVKEIGAPIFQRSYYDHVIRDQRDYNECWEYIEYNPRKWVIMKKGVE